ncbi:MAG: hypothetical protein AAF741_00320 [Bacteroidota bacterium]
MRKVFGYTATIFMLILSCMSCGADSLDKEAALREIAQERLDRIKSNILRDCREEVLELANQRADSLLLERAKKIKRLADRPPKPTRPGEPPNRELSGELPLRPLFPYEIRFDSLLKRQLTLDSLMRDSLLVVDTLGCGDCDSILQASLKPELHADSLSSSSILDIYCLLGAVEEDCSDNEQFSSVYAQRFYRLLLRRSRAIELSLEALSVDADSISLYFPEVPEDGALRDSIDVYRSSDNGFWPLSED